MIDDLKIASHWNGLWTALVTPLDSELQLDKKSFQSLVKSLDNKTHKGFIIAGSTGEGSLIGSSTYKELLSFSRKTIPEQYPLVAGLGIGGTLEQLENLKLAKNLGYQAVLSSVPAYVKPTQKGIFNHYVALAQHNIPVCVYEIPGRAASTISINALKKLNSLYPDIFTATKDATGNLQRQRNQVNELSPKMALLSGDDFSYVDFLELGGHGIISVASHIFSKEFKYIFDNARGNPEKCHQLLKELKPSINSLFSESNPIPVKSYLKEEEIISQAHFCPPLHSMSSDKMKELKFNLKGYHAKK